MKMPTGYEEAQVQGERELPEVGGHHMVIKGVKTMTSRNGKPMIVVCFDFAKNDRQPDFFMNQFKADTRQEKKWPRRGTQYIVITGNDGNTTKSYKTFCTCYENSNGKKINWVEDDTQWCAQFKNAKIGGAFGIVHGLWDSPNNGLVETKNPELRWFVSDDKVDPESVPRERELSDEDRTRLNNANGSGADLAGFVNAPIGEDDEVPF